MSKKKKQNKRIRDSYGTITLKELEEKGKQTKAKFGLDEGDIENIFDMLEKEHPDL